MGEAMSVSKEAAEFCKVNLHHVTEEEGYSPDQVFNADKMGVLDDAQQDEFNEE